MATKKTTPATRGATSKATRGAASKATPRATTRARTSTKAGATKVRAKASATTTAAAPKARARTGTAPAKGRSTSQARAAVPFTTERAEAAFAHFLPLAAKVPTEGLAPCRADVTLVRALVARSVEALHASLATVRDALPARRVAELLELPALALALAHAATRVERPTLAPELEKRLAVMRPMREAALRQLEVFALLDLIPAEVPAAIRKGAGALDAAEDARVIPSVFQDNEELIGHRHPFTSAMLKKLGEDGAFLIERLLPLEAAREAADRSPEAVVLSQLWAVLSERHDDLRQVFAALFGVKGLDAAIPPLARSPIPA